MQPLYVTKSLAALSTTGIGAVSSGQSSMGTINSSNLDTARRIAYYSSVSADNSAVIFTITGKSEQGATITETIKGSTATALVQTTQDYLSVTSIVASCTVNAKANFGTSSVGGTPWKIVNTAVTPICLGAGITLSTSANSMSGQIDMTMDDLTGAYTNPNLTVPSVFNSTTHVGAATSTSAWGAVNADVSNFAPIAAWRLTITSSSSSAGSVSATVIQAGVG